MKKKLAFVLLFLFVFNKVSAQQKSQDSTKAIYQDIQNLSKKNKFNKLIYKLIFRSSALKAKNLIPKKTKKKSVNQSKANGKIIRDIYIETLDPFGNSITDKSKVPRNDFEKYVTSASLFDLLRGK